MSLQNIPHNYLTSRQLTYSQWPHSFLPGSNLVIWCNDSTNNTRVTLLNLMPSNYWPNILFCNTDSSSLVTLPPAPTRFETFSIPTLLQNVSGEAHYLAVIEEAILYDASA